MCLSNIRRFLRNQKLLNFTTLIGLLPSTVRAILPARIHFRYIQQVHTLALQKKGSYSGHVTPGNAA